MVKILTWFLLVFGVVSASPIASIDDIKQAYRDINSRQASLTTVQKEIEGISSEGAVAKYFFEPDGSLALIRLNVYGETGRGEEEYYLQNGKLFFVYSVDYRYNEPFTSGGYDPAKTQIRKNRYYFLRGSMVKWLNNTGRKISEKSARFKNKEQEISHFVKQYLLANIHEISSRKPIRSLVLEDGSRVALYDAEEEGRVTVTAKRFNGMAKSDRPCCAGCGGSGRDSRLGDERGHRGTCDNFGKRHKLLLAQAIGCRWTDAVAGKVQRLPPGYDDACIETC